MRTIFSPSPIHLLVSVLELMLKKEALYNTRKGTEATCQSDVQVSACSGQAPKRRRYHRVSATAHMARQVSLIYSCKCRCHLKVALRKVQQARPHSLDV